MKLCLLTLPPLPLLPGGGEFDGAPTRGGEMHLFVQMKTNDSTFARVKD